MYNGDILLYPHMSKCLQYKWQYKGLKFNGLLYPHTGKYQPNKLLSLLQDEIVTIPTSG